MTRGERVIAFIEKYAVVPEGKLVGKPLRLDPFQRRFVLGVYDNPKGTARGILSIARKNGKSGLIAALLLAHLVGPEARLNSQIVSGARSREQAAVVFKLAWKMVQLSPELMKLVRAVPSHKQLVGLPLNVEYRALAAEGSTAHGLSPVLVILDELGQVRGPKDDFVEALITAQGAYDDGLQLVISTQAPTDADMLSLWIDDAVRSEDPHTVCHVYAADEDAELDDREQWRKANPALGSFRSEADLEKQAATAQRMPSAEQSFRNLGLNQRVNVIAAFVSASVWKAGNEAPDEPAFLRHPNYGALDLSATTDLTAWLRTVREDGILHVRAKFWMPEASIREAARRDKAPYEEWARMGLISLTPGAVIDYSFVAKEVLDDIADVGMAKIAFDRWRMDRLEKEFAALGADLPLEPFGQGFQSMSPALDALEADLLQGRIRHGGNPVLAMCAANAVAVKDAAGNRKLDKGKATGRIDGLVALAMAEGIEAMSSSDVSVEDWLKSLAA